MKLFAAFPNDMTQTRHPQRLCRSFAYLFSLPPPRPHTPLSFPDLACTCVPFLPLDIISSSALSNPHVRSLPVIRQGHTIFLTPQSHHHQLLLSIESSPEIPQSPRRRPGHENRAAAMHGHHDHNPANIIAMKYPCVACTVFSCRAADGSRGGEAVVARYGRSTRVGMHSPPRSDCPA
jgi:hypothetical protein